MQLALEKTAALAAEKLGADTVTKALEAGTDIAIVGDNDFYSQRAQVRGRPPFHDWRPLTGPGICLA